MIDKEIRALINLLEDPDLQIFNAVSEKLHEKGIEAIPSLERAWETSISQVIQEKIEDIIQSIQFSYVKNEFTNWTRGGGKNLLYGAYLISKYQYPDLYFSEIEEQIEILRRDAWLELHENLTALEKVRVLNHVFFAIHKFNRNSGNFYSPRNSFINQVFETKKGNPISLAVIYSAVAEKLEIPIFGVNLPLNYILAYKDPFNSEGMNGILFYINPYNRGMILSRKDIDHFLKQQKLDPKQDYFVPCNNITTIERMLRNLVFAYEKMGYADKTSQVNEILSIIRSAKNQ